MQVVAMMMMGNADDSWPTRIAKRKRKVATFFDAPLRGHDLLRHSIFFRPLLRVLQCFFQVEHLAAASSSLTAEERGRIFPTLRVPAAGGAHIDNAVMNPKNGPSAAALGAPR